MPNEFVIKWLFKFLKIKYSKKKINLYFMNEKYVDSLKIFELVSIIDDVVKVKLLGNCVSCSVNQMTLKNGVEMTVKKHAPEIQKVVSIE